MTNEKLGSPMKNPLSRWSLTIFNFGLTYRKQVFHTFLHGHFVGAFLEGFRVSIRQSMLSIINFLIMSE